ncbi:MULTISPECIES: hypothetical protein [Bacillaceae]|uniref:EfeO-type cupredoxin-like domain-containing protein n=1 Tax=Evansella alkalicola TaxID=745819 RepID=A0ABS6JPR7_9BACI|nr:MULTISPECIES: hypothetical protein [Bacillaceae]MBU9720091.1 hypothetical protein [Bacillus alkalicola]
MRFIVLKRKTILAFAVFALALASVWVSANMFSNEVPAISFGNESEGEIREIHMVTGEFKTTTEDGREIESYRWDPGTIFLEAGEKANLVLYGVNGHEHPFKIEGTDITGNVKKGEETVVPIQFEEEGIYRLICVTHADKDNNGPMIAYIIVD